MYAGTLFSIHLSGTLCHLISRSLAETFHAISRREHIWDTLLDFRTTLTAFHAPQANVPLFIYVLTYDYTLFCEHYNCVSRYNSTLPFDMVICSESIHTFYKGKVLFIYFFQVS